ncbi:acyl transferase/acyl hydrolase/lysophospholipase [Aspergillus caelatus]|uniref:Acyl transferase/acyl hydrolase/lysophospholipase n=1 Tax=Aspergillus caelatus TaxID=61420 RepID=A0A5N6ZIJ4_9EURO|nr:acyl transferase/acyl hydrolase/lysophospholipase [Aspergillus caelatus]KAE8357464.1 acyl transferase/acyl hydrolase/lysophospholipase [Aspergillus caelatus]
MASRHSDEDHPICLLSLDGGGVRGLSTLLILKKIINGLNKNRRVNGLEEVRLYQVFDLVGGTAAGGLIAIMLGRLKMDIDDCIEAFNCLMENIFTKAPHWTPFSWVLRFLPKWVMSQYDSEKLANEFTCFLDNKSIPKDAPLNEPEPECNVFVRVLSEGPDTIECLRSYTSGESAFDSVTILDATLATSVATGYFHPITISGRQFIDGGIGANNPIEKVESEAKHIYHLGGNELRNRVTCFISIGTGKAHMRAMEGGSLTRPDGMQAAAEDTARKFTSHWAVDEDVNRRVANSYFRLNVDSGLQDIGLHEYTKINLIEHATTVYLEQVEVRVAMDEIVSKLGERLRSRELIRMASQGIVNEE